MYKKTFAKKPKKKLTLTKVENQVAAIKKAIKEERIFNYYGDYQLAVTMSADFATPRNLTLISAWSNLFGTANNDNERNAFILRSIKLQVYCYLNNEPDGAGITAMIIRPKKEGAINVNLTTGALTLSTGVDYWVTAGMAQVNPKKFDVLYHQTKLLFQNGYISATPAQTMGGTDMYFERTISCNFKVLSSTGDAHALICPQDPTKNIYLVFFNNNQSVDVQNPAYNYNSVIKCQDL